jgi:hypothetical protein
MQACIRTRHTTRNSRGAVGNASHGLGSSSSSSMMGYGRRKYAIVAAAASSSASSF